jgi:hypothetical protein
MSQNQQRQQPTIKQVLNFSEKKPVERGTWQFEQVLNPNNYTAIVEQQKPDKQSIEQRQFGSSYVSHWVNSSSETSSSSSSNSSTTIRCSPVSPSSTAITSRNPRVIEPLNDEYQQHPMTIQYYQTQQQLYREMFDVLTGREQVEWLDHQYIQSKLKLRGPRSSITISDILLFPETRP